MSPRKCRITGRLALMFNRIDRYTRAAQSSGNDLTRSNLQPAGEVPHTPKSLQGALPGSPNQSTQTHPSTGNPGQAQSFSTLPPGVIAGSLYPAQQARLHPSASTADITSLQAQPGSPTSAKDSGNVERPRRTSSMTINPSIVSGPQPQQSPSHYISDEPGLGLSRTTSSVTLDSEPRIFPGVVSRSRRRNSMRNSQIEDPDLTSAHSGFRKGEPGVLPEERNIDIANQV